MDFKSNLSFWLISFHWNSNTSSRVTKIIQNAPRIPVVHLKTLINDLFVEIFCMYDEIFTIENIINWQYTWKRLHIMIGLFLLCCSHVVGDSDLWICMQILFLQITWDIFIYKCTQINTSKRKIRKNAIIILLFFKCKYELSWIELFWFFKQWSERFLKCGQKNIFLHGRNQRKWTKKLTC